MEAIAGTVGKEADVEGKHGQKLSDWMNRGRELLAGVREHLKKKDLKKWLTRDNMIILILSGVLVFIIAMPMESKDETKQEGVEASPFLAAEPEDSKNAAEDDGTQSAVSMDEEQYLAYQENRLTEALAKVAGVGRVQVMITLKSSREAVVERETPVSRSATNETDSQGGSRVISQVETGDSVVYRSEGTDSEPFVIKTLAPEIEGVLVVAEGAGNGTVNRTITAIVQALFGVEAHKVSVVRMAE